MTSWRSYFSPSQLNFLRASHFPAVSLTPVERTSFDTAPPYPSNSVCVCVCVCVCVFARAYLRARAFVSVHSILDRCRTLRSNHAPDSYSPPPPTVKPVFRKRKSSSSQAVRLPLSQTTPFHSAPQSSRSTARGFGYVAVCRMTSQPQREGL